MRKKQLHFNEKLTINNEQKICNNCNDKTIKEVRVTMSLMKSAQKKTILMKTIKKRKRNTTVVMKTIQMLQFVARREFTSYLRHNNWCSLNDLNVTIENLKFYECLVLDKLKGFAHSDDLN